MKHIYRNIITGIRNLVVWFPVIWRDRQYDHYYLERIVLHKITLMRQRWSNPKRAGAYVGEDIDLKWLKITEELGRRITEGYYWTYSVETGRSLELADKAEEKARKLFWRIIKWRSPYWWD